MRSLVIAVLFVSILALVGCQKKEQTMSVTTPGGKATVTVPGK